MTRKYSQERVDQQHITISIDPTGRPALALGNVSLVKEWFERHSLPVEHLVRELGGHVLGLSWFSHEIKAQVPRINLQENIEAIEAVPYVAAAYATISRSNEPDGWC